MSEPNMKTAWGWTWRVFLCVLAIGLGILFITHIPDMVDAIGAAMAEK